MGTKRRMPGKICPVPQPTRVAPAADAGNGRTPRPRAYPRVSGLNLMRCGCSASAPRRRLRSVS